MMQYNEPDYSKGDYYCKLCDSHMNCEAMWQTHISGRRHITNAKKSPGETLSKVKFVQIKDLPLIVDQIREITDPVVGLGFTSETRRSDPSIQPIYNCYLCQGTFTSEVFLDHVLSLKHRLNYLRKVDPENAMQMETIKLKDYQFESIVLEMCREKQNVLGRGYIEVKVEKPQQSIVVKGRMKPEPMFFPPFPPHGRPPPSRASAISLASSCRYESPRPFFLPFPPFGPMDVPGSPKIKKEKRSSIFFDPAAGPKSPTFKSSSSESEHEFDLMTDYKHLKPEHIGTILNCVADDIEKHNPKAGNLDPYKVEMSKTCFRLAFRSLVTNAYKKASPAEKKLIESSFSKEGEKARLEKKRRALFVPGISKYQI